MEGFTQNSREITHIVGGKNVGSMHVKDRILKSLESYFLCTLQFAVQGCDPVCHSQHCFMGSPRKCSGEWFWSVSWGLTESALGSAPESAGKLEMSRGLFSRVLFLGKEMAGEHSQGHFLGNLPGKSGKLPDNLCIR